MLTISLNRIVVVMNFTTMTTSLVVRNPADSPLRVILIFPNIVVVNNIDCRVFRNVQFDRHSQNFFSIADSGPTEFVSGVSEVEVMSLQEQMSRFPAVSLPQKSLEVFPRRSSKAKRQILPVMNRVDFESMH